MAMLFSFAVIYRLHYRSHQSSIRRAAAVAAQPQAPATVSYFQESHLENRPFLTIESEKI